MRNQKFEQCQIHDGSYQYGFSLPTNLAPLTCLPAHEISRHIDILATKSSVPQETRGFDENTFETFKLRSKEDAPDYRYMPDPNLGTLVLSEVSSSKQ